MSSAWLCVLARDPEGAKSRLAAVLSPADRRELAVATLGDVLDAAGGVGFAKRFVVTESELVRALARAAGFEALSAPRSGTNAAATVALEAAAAAGAPAALILASDLPLLTSADLEALLDAGRDADVVIAPDAEGQGTNALLAAPPRRISPAFGDSSFAEHRRRATAAGARLRVVASAGLSRDLDDEEDLASVARAPVLGRRTAAVLQRIRGLAAPR